MADALSDGTGFFQPYTPADKTLAEGLVHRAETTGFKAIVVTLDTSLAGWRPRDLNESNFPQLRGHALANYVSDPHFRASLDRPPEDDPTAVAGRWASIFGKPLTWSDLPWLRSLTKLPLILKGICHPDDARRVISPMATPRNRFRAEAPGRVGDVPCAPMPCSRRSAAGSNAPIVAGIAAASPDRGLYRFSSGARSRPRGQDLADKDRCSCNSTRRILGRNERTVHGSGSRGRWTLP